MPPIGLEAVIENIGGFEKNSKIIVSAYSDMDKGASGVEASSMNMGSALTSVAGVLSTTVVAAAAAIAGVAVGLGVVAKAAFDMASDVNDATNNIQTDLGITEEEAEKLGEIATDIWANNFGESVNEVSDAIVLAKQRWKDINDLDLQNSVENAYKLRDAFGIDISDSINAAKVLTDKFGLSQQQAFDFITKGFQKGLNSSGDFLDTITEYSGLFGQSGVDAGEFFSILETGLAGGVLGTDKAADLFKEFSLRIIDGSDATAEALSTLQGPTEDLIGQLEDGSLTVGDAFTMIKDRIWDLDDPIEQQRLGVALFGTQWEDLGTEAALSIDATKTKLDDLTGATDGLNKQYDNLNDLWQDIWRDLLVAIQPIGDALLKVGKDVMPLIQDAINEAIPYIEEFAEILAVWLTDAIENLIPWIKDSLIPAVVDFAKWINNELIPALKGIWEWVKKYVLPLIQKLFKSFDKDGKKAQKTFEKIWKDISKAMEPIIEEIFPALLELWQIILDWTKKNWPLIQRTIETVLKEIEKQVDKVLTWIEAFWDDWGETILTITTTYFGFIFRTIKRAMETILDIITLIMQIITGDWEGAWETILQIADRILKQIKDLVDTMFSIIKDIAINAAKLMMEGVVAKYEEMKAKVNEKLEALKTIITTIWEAIKSLVLTKVEEIKGIVTTKFDEIKTAIETKMNEIKAKIDSIWNEIKTNIINKITEFKEAAKQLMDGIIAGINEKAAAVVTALTTTITNALSAVVTAISTVGSALYNATINLGKGIMTKIAEGFSKITTFATDLISTISGWINSVLTTANDIWTKAGALGKAIIEKIIQTIEQWTRTVGGVAKTFKDLIIETISSWINSIVTTANAIWTEAKAIGTKIIDAVIQGIENAKQSLKDMLAGVADLIPDWLREWLGISSPAKVLIPIGFEVGAGIAKGIMQSADLIKAAVQNVTAPVALTSTAIPAGVAAGQAINNYNFNLGGNNINNGMDAAQFDARVMDTIRRFL